MAVSSASRFAVLHVEDYDSDECSDPGNRNSKNASSDKSKKGKGTPAAATTAQTKNKSKKKKNNANNDSAELQNLIFGTGKSKSKANANSSSSSSKEAVKSSQWEEWKVKDNKFVSDSYEQDLQQALLLSKVQYEENKELNLVKTQQSQYQNRGGGGGEGTEVEETSKKKKKSGSSGRKEKASGATTMSLEQFNNLLPSQIDAGVHNLVSNGSLRPAENGVPERAGSVATPEDDFFDKIEEDAEKIIRSEQRRDNFKKNEPFIAEHALSLELRDELEKKDKIIEELTSANVKLKEELKSVKYRNKKLCNILAQAEMKDKAEILVQAEKLRNLKDELTEEVSSLHAALEQEKSKVHLLQSELKKQQGGKKEQKKESTS